MDSKIHQPYSQKFCVGSSNVIKNITGDVMRDCAKADIIVEENVISLAVRLLSLDPSYGLRLDSHYDRRALEEFVFKCVVKFTDFDNSSVKALNMQAFFMDHCIDEERITNYNTELLKYKTLSLTQEIIGGSFKYKEDRDKLFKKLVFDIIVNATLGSPTNSKMFQELSNVLRSVMSKNDISGFLGLKKAERYQSLINLREIVCGIYVFNTDSGLCQEGAIDMEPFLLSSYTTTKTQLNIAQDEIHHRINLIATALNLYTTATNDHIRISISSADHTEYYEDLKDVLIMHRQHAYYVDGLISSLAKTKVDIDQCLKLFKEKINSIHEVVKFRTAIPTEKIFPKFKELAHCWLRLQTHVYILSEINLVNETMMQLSHEVHAWEDMAYALLGDNHIESDATREQRKQSTKINAIDENVKVSDYVKNMKIEYMGFCTTTIVVGQGLLMPAIYSLGICTYKEKNYAFQSGHAAKLFQQNPEKYIFGIIEIARTHPELIVFLDIFEDVKFYRDDYHRVQSNIVQKSTTEVEVQTETHPVPRCLDKDYTWNIWDYRRRAIQLANIRKCKTTSTQTTVNYQRYGAATQTWSPRENASQTNADTSTNSKITK